MTYLFNLLAGTPLTTQDWVMGSDWQVVCGVRGHHRCSHCPFEIKLSANVPCSSRGTGRLVFSKATCINISSNCTRLVVVTTSSLAGSNGGISVLKQPSAMLKGWGPNSPQGWVHFHFKYAIHIFGRVVRGFSQGAPVFSFHPLDLFTCTFKISILNSIITGW